MSRERNGRLFAEGLIGVSVCVGAYMTLIEPMQRELVDLRATSDAQVAEQAATPSPIDSASFFERAGERLEVVDAACEPARNESTMYARMTGLADAVGVRIEQFQQRAPAAGPSRSASGASAQANAAAEAAAADSTVGYTLTMIGTYGAVCEIIARLRAELGYAVVRSATLTPVSEPGSNAVIAVIESDHFAFDTAGPRALLSKARDAAPEGTP